MTSSQTAVFRQIVGDHMAPAPIAVPTGMPAVEVVGRMAEAEASAVVVVDARRAILGIITEQDVVRRVARSASDAPVQTLMTSPVLTIHADDHLYEAIGSMRRHRLRHMPVVDGDGRLWACSTCTTPSRSRPAP
jgi:CBS domain-containing protein